MPKKPTQTFGMHRFSKDGTVSREASRLPDDKAGQEAKVADGFARGMELFGESWTTSQLPENDHDFSMTGSETGPVVVQATEIVPRRDFMTAISAADYEQLAFQQPGIVVGEEQAWKTDYDRRRQIIWDRIAKKKAKHYAATEQPLWLLIWTVDFNMKAYFLDGDVPTVTEPVAYARQQLHADGCAPFSQIWYWQPMLRPYRIWPIPVGEDAVVEGPPRAGLTLEFSAWHKA